MAVGASTVWRIRAGGNNANGAGFDSTISGAGTDYTQQDAAQLSVTDIACSSTTTVTSATGGFTSAMIGNAIRITGGGATSGYYFITAVTDTNTITVDRTPGSVSGGTGKVGGSAASPETAPFLLAANSTGNKMVPGNTVYIRGSGSQDPASADYTFSSFCYQVAGDTTSGKIKFIGENGRPRLDGIGLWYHNANYCRFEELAFKAASATQTAFGVASLTNHDFINCLMDAGNLDLTMLKLKSSTAINCEIRGHTSRPSSSATNHLVLLDQYNGRLLGCHIYNSRARGVSGFGDIVSSVIHDCLSDGVAITGSVNGVGSHVTGNVIDDNDGHGINVLLAEDASQSKIYNNVITNHATSGKKGLRVNTGITTVNDKLLWADYNAFYNNAANYENISAGANDVSLSADPYTDSSTGDYTLNSTSGGGADLVDAGYPQSIPGT